MKKKLSVLLLATSLLFSTPVTGWSQEELATPSEETEAKEEVRDQNILVPTSKGVQKATKKEADFIQKYEQNSLEELTNAYLVGDYRSGQILEAHNIDEVVGMASTSKLVSTFVIMDKIKDGTISLEDIITIDKESASLIGSTCKLKENDQVSVERLLESSLIVSGNDAVTALGKYIAGSEEAFVRMMNDKCKDLGLEQAHMVNTTGLTDYLLEDYNKMTTREMFTLTCELLREHSSILEITKKEEISEPEREFIGYNSNPLLGIVPQIDGLKTGYTNIAGRCLVATGFKSGVEGVTEDIRLVGITMGSRGDWQRYVAAKRLMLQAFDRYSWKQIANKDNGVASLHVERGKPEDVEAYPEKPFSVLWDGEKEIRHEVQLETLTPPVKEGAVVGTVTYYVDDEAVWVTDLVTKQKVKEANFFYKMQHLLKDIYEQIEQSA